MFILLGFIYLFSWDLYVYPAGIYMFIWLGFICLSYCDIFVFLFGIYLFIVLGYMFILLEFKCLS